MPTPSRNASAVATASWPTIASMTKMISSGLTASRMSAACAIISASMPSRPAVSTMTMSRMLRAGVLDRVPGHLHRVADAVARLGRVHLDAGPLAEHLELVDRVGALQVAGDQQRLVALALEPAGQLAGERGLTGALQAGQHDHRRRLLGELQPPGLAAEDARPAPRARS